MRNQRTVSEAVPRHQPGGASPRFGADFGRKPDASAFRRMVWKPLRMTAFVAGGLLFFDAAARAEKSYEEIVGAATANAIQAVAPDDPVARPAKPRKLLVITESERDLERHIDGIDKGHHYVPHASAADAALALKAIGEKTGAYEATLTSSGDVFTKERLAEFDAVAIANTNLFDKLWNLDPPESDKGFGARQAALQAFVEAGGGLVGIHAAAIEAPHWPWWNETLGGTHFGHLRHAGATTELLVTDPEHPLYTPWRAKALATEDDIYHFVETDIAEKSRVLLTAEIDGARYPVAWIRRAGKGRVFYTALGHDAKTYRQSWFQNHLLAGVQYALGDIEADATPIAVKLGVVDSKPAGEGWKCLYDAGSDLSGWKSDPKPKTGWVPDGPILRYDGNADTLFTAEDYGDFEQWVDWRMPNRHGDTGVYVRGGAKGQVNIWTWDEGSGELWAQGHAQPLVNADKPVGEWNRFRILMQDDRLSVWLNGQKVIDAFQMQGLPAKGGIALQKHGSPFDFKRIFIRPLVFGRVIEKSTGGTP